MPISTEGSGISVGVCGGGERGLLTCPYLLKVQASQLVCVWGERTINMPISTEGSGISVGVCGGGVRGLLTFPYPLKVQASQLVCV